jgi:multidrug efflux system outer membrane protein
LILNHLFEPNAVVGNIAGGLVGPLVNKRSIRAQYLTANARQMQAIYNYQRVILEAFTQVINRMTKVENYSNSIDIKRQQLKTLEDAVQFAEDLFQLARIEYIDVLFSQRDLRDARVVLIDTKTEQLASIVQTYQALGGGVFTISTPADFHGQYPYIHTVRNGENFRTISLLYYRSSRYGKALWAANKDAIPEFDRLKVGDKIIIPPVDQLDKALVEEAPAPPAPVPGTAPADEPATVPAPLPAPPPADAPGPFGQKETADNAVKATSGTNPRSASLMPATTGK